MFKEQEKCYFPKLSHVMFVRDFDGGFFFVVLFSIPDQRHDMDKHVATIGWRER